MLLAKLARTADVLYLLSHLSIKSMLQQTLQQLQQALQQLQQTLLQLDTCQ